MAVALSLRDVERLLSEPSAILRAELAEKVTTGLSEPGLTAAEIKLAQDIILILARDLEATVRACVARGVRHSPHLPRDAAKRLANDVDMVALPLLADSLVLTDEDLVEVIRQGSDGKHEAIAGRRDLSETVSGILIDCAREPAVQALLENHTARIGEASLNSAVTRFTGSDAIKRALVSRPGLPMTVAERLVTLISTELQGQLVRMHALPPKIASDIVLASREAAIIHLSAGSSEVELARMIAQMQDSERLTPTLMLRALCTGDIAFFEVAMAAKANVPLLNAQILIHEASRRGLAAVYRQATMPDYMFEAIRAAVDVVDETGFDGNARDLERYRTRVISRVLTLTDAMDPMDAEYLIDKLGDILGSSPAAGLALAVPTPP